MDPRRLLGCSAGLGRGCALWRALAALALAFLGAMECDAVRAAELALRVRQANGQPLARAVVMLHALDHPAAPPAPIRATIDQIDRTFVPDVLVIPVGSSVSFPNTDKVRHQVYSFSSAHRFQLPLYSGKPYPPERFDRMGIVTLGCNIHDSMLAYIVVTDAELVGSTDARGIWVHADVARGRYRLELWHPRLRDPASTLKREVTVSEGERMELPITLDQALRPGALAPHPHSWDSY